MDFTEKMVKDVAEMAIAEIENGEDEYIAVENAICGIMGEFDDNYDDFCKAVANEINNRNE